jgi:hypothetical protein
MKTGRKVLLGIAAGLLLAGVVKTAGRMKQGLVSDDEKKTETDRTGGNTALADTATDVV